MGPPEEEGREKERERKEVKFPIKSKWRSAEMIVLPWMELNQFIISEITIHV